MQKADSAKVAAKLAVGYTLDEISNDVGPWDDEKAMNSYAYHKIMEDAADKAARWLVSLVVLLALASEVVA